MVGARADAPVTVVARGGRPPPRRDWTLRAFDAVPLSPVWTGLGLMIAYMLLAGLIRAVAAALPGPGPRPSLPLLWELVNGLVIATPLTLNAYALRGALADLRDLRPELDLGDADFARWSAEVTCAPKAWLAVSSSVSVAVMVAVVLFDPSIWGSRPRPGPRDPLFYWTLLHNAASAYAFGRMFATEGALTRGYARIAETLRIDLLDAAPLDLLARKGQRSVLLWILLSSCVSLFWFGGDPAVINIFVLTLTVGVAVTAFAVPLSRVRVRIAAAKRVEVRRVNAALASAREELLAGRAGEAGRIADLVAWRELIEAVHEWPVNLPTLLRSGLFVLLGIGSWLGGAVVDRIVEALFPR